MFQPLHINQSYLVEETTCIKGQPKEIATHFYFIYFFLIRGHVWVAPCLRKQLKAALFSGTYTGRPEKPRLAIAEVQDKGSATLR